MDAGARKRPRKSEPTPIRGRADWIRAAFDMLAENSVDALRIDELAARLRVTKGSFYWHFANREDLLEAVLNTWRERMTSGIAAYIAQGGGEPRERLSRLLRTGLRVRPDTPGSPLEISLRDWARRDARVRQAISELDAQRLSVVEQLYRDAGVASKEAREAALAHLAMTIGMRMIAPQGSDDDSDRRARIAEGFLLSSVRARGANS